MKSLTPFLIISLFTACSAEYQLVKRPADEDIGVSTIQAETPEDKLTISGPTTAKVQEELTYTASDCPNPDDVVWIVAGQPETVTGPTFATSFQSPGEYTVLATCNTAEATLTVTISANDPLPDTGGGGQNQSD